MKKGQTTIFILMAVIIIAVIIVYYSVERNPINKINSEFQPVYSLVEDCIRGTGEDAIYYTSLRGGYIEPLNYSYIEYPIENTSIIASHNIAYYIYGNKNIMPSKQEIEKELSDYVDGFTYFCTNKINFKEYNVTLGDIETNTVIEENKVIFNSKFSITTFKGENTVNFENFIVEIPVRMGFVYDIVEQIVEKEKQREDICISCLYELSEENNFSINMLEGDDDGIIFIITDKKSEFYEDNYKFYFAKYIEI